MVRQRKSTEEIRAFILDIMEYYPKNVPTLTMKKFGISRQAVYRHIKNLGDLGFLTRSGGGEYEVVFPEDWGEVFDIPDNLEEHLVWENKIRERLEQLPENVLKIWRYGFTEMFNNAVQHSESSVIYVRIMKNSYITEMHILDSGVGIFKKIKTVLGLPDERQAVLELTKGKLTTDPAHHTGEGIFFTSRMFDTFAIMSGEVILMHRSDEEIDWVLQPGTYQRGTWIKMKLANITQRTDEEIFKKFESEDNFGFNKTVVPVRLAQYGDEELISRSQAKRLLSRIDRFQTVILDFAEVKSIGRAFADEVFRVFANEHPDVKLRHRRANDTVSQTIASVLSSKDNSQRELFDN
jgi:anti-sigma regulatory factor (Ser/Thr protein kinase)